MSISSFRKNVLIEIDRRPFKLIRKIDENTWQAEDQMNGAYSQLSTQELLNRFSNGGLKFIDVVTSESDRQKAIAEIQRKKIAYMQADDDSLKRVKLIRAYVQAADKLPISEKALKPVIHETWLKLGSIGKPPHWITLSRWIKKYVHGGGTAFALLPEHFKKGNRKKRISKELEVFLDQAIENTYLTRERRTVEDTLNAAIVLVENENKLRPQCMQIPLPSRQVLQSRINLIDAFDRYAARYGHMAATRKFRAVLHMNIVERPLQCAEIDHTKLDLMVIDDDTGMVLGRPWITICIDRKTRCILGIYISFQPPSFLTVSRCLRHVFAPKVTLKEEFPSIKNDWCSFGIMERLVVDNGLEFHGDGLEKACLYFGIDLKFTPRKTPWWKGAVERVIGTMNREIAHGNPGTTFENIFEKDDYDALQNAVVTLTDIKSYLHKWVVDVYHQRPHRALDMQSPQDVWNSNINLEDIKLPNSIQDLDSMLGKPALRILTHKGIEYERLFYNSEELRDLRRKHGDKLKVELRVDEGNLEKMFVLSPVNDEIIEVPCLHQDYAKNLSLWQHKVCIRYSATLMKRSMKNDVNAWRHAKQEIIQQIRESFTSKKKRTHSKAQKFLEPMQQSKSPGVLNVAASEVLNEITFVETRSNLMHERNEFKPVEKLFTAVFQER